MCLLWRYNQNCKSYWYRQAEKKYRNIDLSSYLYINEMKIKNNNKNNITKERYTKKLFFAVIKEKIMANVNL